MNYYIDEQIFANTKKQAENTGKDFDLTFYQAKSLAENYINRNYKLQRYNEDLVSNLITSIWCAYKKFDKNKGKSFRNYILDHCKWTILEYNSYKKEYRCQFWQTEKTYKHSSFEEFDSKQTIDILLTKTILTPKEIQAIKYKYYEGLSSREIATKMKVTRSYVNKLLKDALAEMRLSANRLKIS